MDAGRLNKSRAAELATEIASRGTDTFIWNDEEIVFAGTVYGPGLRPNVLGHNYVGQLTKWGCKLLGIAESECHTNHDWRTTTGTCGTRAGRLPRGWVG